MKIKEVLTNTAIYPDNPNDVKIIETHISIISLTGVYAYKFKKPVDFGFLDYTTLAKRKYYCEEELRRNKKSGKFLYNKVVTLNKDGSNYAINGSGEIIDYAVQMREFPQEYIMKEVLKRGELTDFQLTVLGDMLAKHYKTAETNKYIASFGDFNHIKESIDENFEQILKKVGKVISKKRYDFIVEKTNDFLEEHKDLFEKRRKEGYVRELHGDLHSGNIVLWERVHIFDAIEFNERFKYMDIISDFSFLLMDLDHYDAEIHAKKLLDRYIQKSKDYDALKLVNFYKCYRAFVRGKVLSFMHNKEKAQEYFNQAYAYASMMEYRYPDFKKPTLIMVAGLSGSGKTYCARQLRQFFGIEHLNTDKIRKEFFKHDPHVHRFNNGLYSSQNRKIVYERMYGRIETLLSQGSSCIVDATFLEKYMRTRMYDIRKKYAAQIILIHPKTSENKVREHLEKRKNNKGSVSDADWTVYLKQKQSFKGFDADDRKYLIEVAAEVPGWVEKVYDSIIARLK
jgi:uncharacterized protein